MQNKVYTSLNIIIFGQTIVMYPCQFSDMMHVSLSAGAISLSIKIESTTTTLYFYWGNTSMTIAYRNYC